MFQSFGGEQMKQAKVLSSEELKRVTAICVTMQNGKRNRLMLMLSHYAGMMEALAAPYQVRSPTLISEVRYLADLLASNNNQDIPRGRHIKALDIGTGASLVYPSTGQSEYDWHFTGVDIDAGALKSARQISELNSLDIVLRQQQKSEDVFRGVIKPDDRFHITMCNPPFHASKEKANKGTQRKWASLGQGKSKKLNFGGQNAELWCPGGEIKFIARMVEQSKEFAGQCLWFTSLVSKKDNLSPLHRILGKAKVADYQVVEMAQGQKTSRFIAWTYIKRNQRSAFLKNAKS